jgi:hypothetical protein
MSARIGYALSNATVKIQARFPRSVLGKILTGEEIILWQGQVKGWQIAICGHKTLKGELDFEKQSTWPMRWL